MFTKADIEKYFRGEKSESLLFLIIGVLSIVAAICFLLFFRSACYRGASIPIGIIGMILGIVGYTVYRRSDDDRIRNVYAFDMDPSHLKNVEIPRMFKVMKNFSLYRYTEIVFVIAGIALFFVSRNDISKEFWKGFGIGLAIISFIALIADFFAEKRGKEYVQGLQSFTDKI